MPIGTVKWFDAKKGYGFIVGPAGTDIFVHYSNIESAGFRALKEGEQVEYDLLDTPKGLQAGHVRHAQQVTP